ncbi:hypothetical protein YC2023_060287 [Brassica napus]
MSLHEEYMFEKMLVHMTVWSSKKVFLSRKARRCFTVLQEFSLDPTSEKHFWMFSIALGALLRFFPYMPLVMGLSFVTKNLSYDFQLWPLSDGAMVAQILWPGAKDVFTQIAKDVLGDTEFWFRLLLEAVIDRGPESACLSSHDDLPVSRLKYNALDDFQEVFQTTSRLAESSPMSLPFITDMGILVFNLMVLIFHSFKDLEDFWDDLPVSHLKYNALDDYQEVFQTTSRKSSDEVFFHIKWSPSLSL